MPALIIALARVLIVYLSPITTSSSASSPLTSSTELLSPMICLAAFTRLNDREGWECKSIPYMRLFVFSFFAGMITGDACLLLNEVPVLAPFGEFG